jgi:cysteine synthase
MNPCFRLPLYRQAQMPIFRDELDLAGLIGRTPLARLERIPLSPGPRVFLKLEHFNPGGSIKDRTAYGLLRRAEEEGRVGDNTTIIESSSGNTAIGLSILTKNRGNRVIAICDRHLPMVKRARLLAFGAETVFLPETPKGMDTVELRIQVANYLSEQAADAVTFDQYSNPANPEIHYSTTGREIWEATEGKVSAVVAAMGTCGTISGVGRYLKERRPEINLIGVEPEGSVIFGGEPGPYLVQGGGLSFKPPNLDESVVDLALKVSDDLAFTSARRTAHEEGWLLGGTGGLVIAGIEQIAEGYGPEDVIVGIIPDAGDRYMDTLFDESWFDSTIAKTSLQRSMTEVDDVIESLGCELDNVDQVDGPSLDEFCRQIGYRAEKLFS